MNLAFFILLAVQLLSTSNNACTPSCSENQHCSTYDDMCYDLITNFISLSMTETGVNETTTTTTSWTLTEFFDNNSTTYGGLIFPELNIYQLYINFTDYEWVHTIEAVSDSDLVSLSFYDINGAPLQIIPSTILTNGKYFYSVEIVQYLAGLVFSSLLNNYYIYEFYISVDSETPSFAPTVEPSPSPSSDVCTDISSVQQSCCASNGYYNITNRVNLLYPNTTYKTCYETSNDECCGGHGLLDGYFKWTETEFGCGEDDNNNRLVCNVSFYNSSTIIGTIVNTTVLYYDSSVDPSIDSSCNCSTVIDYCIGEDTAVCVRNESQALCGQTSFAGSVSSLTVVEESVGYSTCECEYMLSTCNLSMVEDVECEGDSCCSQEEHSCCGTSYLDAGDLDMYGYPVNDVYSWQCYNDTIEVCPDIFGGLRYYNSSYHVEWWNDTSSGSSVMNIQCLCQYLVENCNLPPSNSPTIIPSVNPSYEPTYPSYVPTVNPTYDPTYPSYEPTVNPSNEPAEGNNNGVLETLANESIAVILLACAIPIAFACGLAIGLYAYRKYARANIVFTR